MHGILCNAACLKPPVFQSSRVAGNVFMADILTVEAPIKQTTVGMNQLI